MYTNLTQVVDVEVGRDLLGGDGAVAQDAGDCAHSSGVMRCSLIPE